MGLGDATWEREVPADGKTQVGVDGGATAAANSVRFEEEDRGLARVEVDVMLRLICRIRPEVTPHNAVPHTMVLFDKPITHILCHLFLRVERLQRLQRDIHRVRLHLGRHVANLDYGPREAAHGGAACPVRGQRLRVASLATTEPEWRISDPILQM